MSIAFGASCGEPCERSGCDAIVHPHDGWSIATGIGGAASSQSDVVANGCNECPLSQGYLALWAVNRPVQSAAEAETLTMSRPADIGFDVDETYEVALDPGHYLACIGREPEVCTAITLAAGDKTTVHLRFVFGPPSLIVYEPGQDRPRGDDNFVLNGA